MKTPPIVSPEAWEAPRLEMLVKELTDEPHILRRKTRSNTDEFRPPRRFYR
jgi:hypothetical protein